MKKAKSKKKITSIDDLAKQNLTIEQFGKRAGIADIEKIKQAIADGAPVNQDGTIPVAKFTAWLINQEDGKK